MATHYDSLGVPRSATAAEIKSAYRKLVFQHHPDRSKDPRSPALFMAATEAYEVLNDPERRRTYDETLDSVRRRMEEVEAEKRTRAQTHAPTPDWSNPAPLVTEQVQRLAVMFKRGRFSDAEQLANEIRRTDPRQPLPYAILGDIARARGDMNRAAKWYAYAVQFDPRNPVFQRKYEELLGATRMVTDSSSTRLSGQPQGVAPLVVGAAVVLVGAGYVALSREEPVFRGLSCISSWTVGLVFMLFLSGVAVGSSLAVGGWLDRFTAFALGRVGPAVALGTIAVVNFWAACVAYVALGAAQRAFTFSTSRVLASVAAATLVLTFASAISGPNRPGQVLLWGGNVVYLGALCGWMLTDAMRTG